MDAVKKNWTSELLVAVSVIFASFGQLSIKLGLRHSGSVWTWTYYPLQPPFTVGVLGGLLIYGIGTIFWMAAVSRERISYLYPLASLNYIVVSLFGMVLLHERVQVGRLIGLSVMTAGIVMLFCSASPRSMCDS